MNNWLIKEYLFAATAAILLCVLVINKPWNVSNYEYEGTRYQCDEIAFNNTDSLLYTIYHTTHWHWYAHPTDTIRYTQQFSDTIRGIWDESRGPNSHHQLIALVNGAYVTADTIWYYHNSERTWDGWTKYTDVTILQPKYYDIAFRRQFKTYEATQSYRIFKHYNHDTTVIKVCYIDANGNPYYNTQRHSMESGVKTLYLRMNHPSQYLH